MYFGSINFQTDRYNIFLVGCRPWHNPACLFWWRFGSNFGLFHWIASSPLQNIRTAVFMYYVCLSRLSNVSEPGVIRVGVSRIILYPHYSLWGPKDVATTGDIALLKLSSPVTFTDTIRPICLPSRDVNVNRFKVCVATGFGKTSYNGR